MSAPCFTCECVGPRGEVLARRDYVVTGFDDIDCVCSYCDECAELARSNWNGETAAIVPACVVCRKRPVDPTWDGDEKRWGPAVCSEFCDEVWQTRGD